MTTTITRQDCLALPYIATSEDKAEQFAAAVEELYAPCVKVKTFEDGGQWIAVVVEGMEHIGDPVQNERIDIAALLLMQYDLVEKTGDIEPIEAIASRVAIEQKALTHRARRAFRIEDKLDIILTALVGSEGAKQIVGDSHRLPDNRRADHA